MLGYTLVTTLALLGATSDTNVNITWDRTPNSTLIYDIRIEPELITELRAGKQISGHVPTSVKDLRFFRISVTQRSGVSQVESSLKRDGVARQENQVDYGWRLATSTGAGTSSATSSGAKSTTTGEIEYLIQIRPERLQALVDGYPIEGEIDPAAGDVRHFFIFVGTGELPREPVARRATNNDSLLRFPSSLSGSRTAANDPNALNRRNEPGPNLRRNYSTGNLDDRAPEFYQDQRTGGYVASDRDGRPYGPDPNSNFGTGYNANPNQGNPNYSNQGYGPGAGYSTAGYQATGYQPNAVSNTGGYVDPGLNAPRQATNYSQAEAQLAANRQAAPTAGVNATNLNSPPLQLQAGTAGYANANMPTAISGKTPSLLLTALGLAVSLGFNTYLGWLAWTFFWRYREVASELARARTDALNARSLA